MNRSNYYYNKSLKEFVRRLRKQSTKGEIKLWKEVLRGRRIHGFSFLRQRPFYKYIADFFCKDLMLIIEVDGYTHEWEVQWKPDQAFANLNHLSVMRFPGTPLSRGIGIPKNTPLVTPLFGVIGRGRPKGIPSGGVDSIRQVPS